MKQFAGFFVLFLSIVFLAVPVFAQEATEQEAIEEVVAVSEEEILFSDEGVITGEVLSLDAASGTITVSADGAQKTFSVLDGETILWRGIEDIELAGIKAGEEAEVGYYSDESGALIASWVDVLVEEKEEEAVSLEVEEEELTEE